MTTQPPRPWLPPLLGAAAVAALAFAGYAWWRAERALAAQAAALAEVRSTLGEVLGEVTRARIEQSAEGKGPAALLEKLAVYAPLLSNARVTEPDYRSAQAEMEAILRAFESIGEDAWAPITSRLERLDVRRDFDEIKWLMEAALRVDLEAGKQIAKDVLLGVRMPNPRLRWHAAKLLTERDRPLAQQLLRRILLTESSRGVHVDRAAQHNMPIPDAAAFATTGFHNFVVAYLRTDDPQTEDTLLMLLGRVEHDQVTIQECIEELGRRRFERAVEPIKRLYADPPLQQQNPLFLNRCLEAIANIQREAAKPWLEQALTTAPTDAVANQIQFQLGRIARGDWPQDPGPR